MNRKTLYAIIAVVVVVILIVAVFAIVVVPTPSKAASITVSASSSIVSINQSVSYFAFISGGTPSKIIFNFGDGSTGKATHLTGNEYTVTHSYTSLGKYLVTANATVNGKYINNLASIIEVSVIPSTVSVATVAELTQPSIVTSTPIYTAGSTVNLIGTILEPPTATNWTVGYYIWSFGDGSTLADYAVLNTSSGSFMPDNISHAYKTAGIYVVTLGVITFNNTSYVPTTYTSNGINYTYYPVSDLSSILAASVNYYNNTYVNTIIVGAAGQTIGLLKTTVPTTNPNEIVVTEVTPGGPYSFDPAIDYDTIGFEELINCYETLLAYNGSSDTEFVPMVTTEIPTVANGGISSNYLNYTFNIRSGLKFSNGDPVTAWDVYASMVRTLLFVDDSPGTAGWILAQDLLPGGGFVGNATSYQNITSCMTLNNASQAVTFHLLKPDSAFLFYFANPEGTCITDYSWLVAHGAGITFTPAGFAAYISQGNETGYNNYIRYDIMGSGPYMIKNYLIGESVVLVPNPYYTPIAGYMGYNHPANDTIYIQWEKDPSTALVMAESGQTDFFWGLPDYDYPILAHLAAEGKIINLISPLLAEYWYQFNVDINTTMLSTLGTGFHIPQYYFANLDVRRAFAYAFNYTNYVDNLLGNSIYGADFGDHHTGIIPKGMGGYMTDTQLQQVGAVVPVYNLTIAKQYMEESGEYNISVNMPIIVSAGDPVDFAGAEDWGSTLSTIDPNIVASALYIESPAISGYTVPDQNPMPIALELWGPDYPFPSDYVVPMYLSSGYFVSASGFAPNIFAAAGYLNESQQDAYMCQLITNAESTGNSTLALKYIDQAQVIAVNLTIDVYLYQINDVLSYSPSIHGFENDVNTMSIGNCYIYLTKT